MIDDVPDGLTPYELIRRLRFIKLSLRDRDRVLLLQAVLKERNLTHEESAELRRMATLHRAAIEELEKSQERARITDAKMVRGSRRVATAIEDAKVATRVRLEKKLEDLESELEQLTREERDMGL